MSTGGLTRPEWSPCIFFPERSANSLSCEVVVQAGLVVELYPRSPRMFVLQPIRLWMYSAMQAVVLTSRASYEQRSDGLSRYFMCAFFMSRYAVLVTSFPGVKSDVTDISLDPLPKAPVELGTNI